MISKITKYRKGSWACSPESRFPKNKTPAFGFPKASNDKKRNVFKKGTWRTLNSIQNITQGQRRPPANEQDDGVIHSLTSELPSVPICHDFMRLSSNQVFSVLLSYRKAAIRARVV